MAWKPKEKPITPEEAVELARKELAHFWLGTLPLLVGLKGPDGRATAHPLDKGFEKRAWVILFADLLDYSGEPALQYAREWTRRYSAHDLGVLLVVRRSYSFISSVSALPPLLKKMVETFPIVIDGDGLLSEAFGRKPGPSVVLLHERKILHEASGPKWVEGVEKQAQKYLRSKDPGLPLALPFAASQEVPRDSARAELGRRELSPLFKLSGKITQEDERIVVQDPAATIRFSCPASQMSIVAMSKSSTDDASRMRVEFNGDAVYESICAQDLTVNDDGGFEVNLKEARLYHVLQRLTGKAREVVLRFPDSERLPVAIYGARFANP